MTPELTIDHLLQSVARHVGVTVFDLRGPRRSKSTAYARGIAMYLSRTLTTQSYPELARRFGGKHHTTVIAAVQRIERRLQTDARLRADIDAVRAILDVRLSGLRFHGEAA